MPAKPTISIRPLAEDGRLTFYWYSGTTSTFTLDISGPAAGPVTLGPGASEYTATGLTNGALYEARLYVNDGTSSSDPAIFRSVRPGLKPSVAQNLGAELTEDGGAVQLSWSAPADNGGTPIGWYVAKDTTSGQRYDTYGTSSNMTVPYVAGHKFYQIQAVNDPGYSPPAVARLSPYSVLELWSNGDPFYQYQVYNRRTHSWLPSYTTDISAADYFWTYYGPAGDYFQMNFLSPGMGNWIQDYIGLNGQRRRRIDFPLGPVTSWGSAGPLNYWWYLNETDNNYLNIGLYVPATDTLRLVSTLFDPNAQTMNGMFQANLENAFFYQLIDAYPPYNVTFNLWNKGWDAPSSIGSGYNTYYLYTDSGFNNDLMVTTSSDGTYYDTIRYVRDDGFVSSFTLPASTYSTVLEGNRFGATSSNFFFKFGASDVAYDYYIFKPQLTLEPIILTGIGASNFSADVFHYLGTYKESQTGKSDNFVVIDGSNYGASNTAATVYVLMGPQSTFTSTVFTDANPVMCGIYDPAQFMRVNSNSVFLIESNALNYNVHAWTENGEITAQLFDAGFVGANFVDTVVPFDGAYYLHTLDHKGINNGFIYESVALSGVSWQDGTNYAPTVAGSNLIVRLDSNAAIGIYYNGAFSITPNFFIGGVQNDTGSAIENPYIDNLTAWAWAIDTGTMSTVSVNSNGVNFVGSPAGIRGGDVSALDLINDHLFLNTGSYDNYPPVLTAVTPAGATVTYDGEGAMGYFFDSRQTNNTDILYNYTFAVEAGPFVNITFDAMTGSFYSTFVDSASSMVTPMTNFRYDLDY